MGWATSYIARLSLGETVSFRPRGGSMSGKIESGQLCTIEPVADISQLAAGDIVLCKVHGNEYLHLIKAIRGSASRSATIAASSTLAKCLSMLNTFLLMHCFKCTRLANSTLRLCMGRMIKFDCG